MWSVAFLDYICIREAELLLVVVVLEGVLNGVGQWREVSSEVVVWGAAFPMG